MTREAFAQHFPPGTWHHPRAREMGLRPDVHLTVEIEFIDHGRAGQAIWERLKANNHEFYYGPIVSTVVDDDDYDDD